MAYPTNSPWSTAGYPNAPHMGSVPLPPPGSTTPQVTPCKLPYSAPHANHASIISLHPLLSYDPSGRMMFDIRQDLRLLCLRPPFTPDQYREQAVGPASTRMAITVPNAPYWQIDVSNPQGVTVWDVLTRLSQVLSTTVNTQEAAALAAGIQAASASFNARCGSDSRVRAQGMKRFDFLGMKFFFVGLTRARDGSDRWEAHFAPRI
ncbi:hypothetical protein CONPUDRAFT_138552 [Coniophora puteana RWD-64-598 SS2]|uniref:DUF6699 domain-containing protein n=1 Tax=Coniophora puteana (strain RWD-64-598) TaxID=741705 RepID=A0A5M3MGP6_CONPW|nr:uncharacterized protein CONPUDRAFT_138552 [Coniophora puteana RWD-64-598 SS2]EIW78120.1 hypothetical protein CONPUDRAFT_138552 [Coniophora puteana RWD-64-598 SS2]